MRIKPLKTRGLILSLSKDEAKISYFFSSPLCRGKMPNGTLTAAACATAVRAARVVNSRSRNIFNGL